MDFNESFFRSLSRSAPVVNLVTGIAEEIATDLREGAPRDTEAYVNGIGVSVKFQDRAVALVTSSDPKTMILESKGAYMVKALNRAKKRHRG